MSIREAGAAGRLRQGFSLLELLVAAVITALLIGLTMRIFSGGIGLWRSSAGRIDTVREARAALHSMERDLRTAVKSGLPAMPSDPPSSSSPLPTADPPSENPAATVMGWPGLLFAHHPDTPEADRANEELYFMTMLPQGGRGNLCAIGYRAVWEAGARCYVLKRRFFKGEEVQALLGEAAANGHGGVPLYFGPGGQEEELARYVWDLQFRACLNGEPATAYSAGSGLYPAWVEIRFKAIGSKAAEKLMALPVARETWRNPADPVYQRAIKPYQKQYVIRARLHASGK